MGWESTSSFALNIKLGKSLIRKTKNKTKKQQHYRASQFWQKGWMFVLMSSTIEGKRILSNMSHVCAGHIRVMLVACLGKVKKGDIGTHTHIHTAPIPCHPPAPPLISRFLSPL